MSGAYIFYDKAQQARGRRHPAIVVIIDPRQPFIVAAGSRRIIAATGCQVLVIAATVRIGQQPGTVRPVFDIILVRQPFTQHPLIGVLGASRARNFIIKTGLGVSIRRFHLISI